MPEFDDTLDLLPAGPQVQDDGLVTDEDLQAAVAIGADEVPAPLGVSWLFDMGAERFVLHGGRPQQTRGTATLIAWIDKFLHTQKGALPVHPVWFGMTDPYGIFGRPVRELSAQALLADMQDMTNHPNIADVVDVSLVTAEDDDAAWLEVQVLTDPPTEDVGVMTVRVPVGG